MQDAVSKEIDKPTKIFRTARQRSYNALYEKEKARHFVSGFQVMSEMTQMGTTVLA